MHASKLQPSGFQAQRFNVSALDIQDWMLNQAFPSQEQRHSLLIARPAKRLDHGCSSALFEQPFLDFRWNSLLSRVLN